MKEGGRVVRAEPRHQAAWRELWQGYLDFYGVRLRPEVTASTWARVTADDGDHRCLVHEDATGMVRGFTVYLFHRASWTDTWNCCIEDLYVAPGARGHGIGRTLLQAVFADARLRRAYRVYWQTDRANTAARRLYDTVAEVADVVQYRLPSQT
jgi:GNAT superfamily N-acetyltransferase